MVFERRQLTHRYPQSVRRGAFQHLTELLMSHRPNTSRAPRSPSELSPFDALRTLAGTNHPRCCSAIRLSAPVFTSSRSDLCKPAARQTRADTRECRQMFREERRQESAAVRPRGWSAKGPLEPRNGRHQERGALLARHACGAGQQAIPLREAPRQTTAGPASQFSEPILQFIGLCWAVVIELVPGFECPSESIDNDATKKIE